MDLLELIKKNRSYRRYLPGFVPDKATLRELVEHARFSATAKNYQFLRFRICNQPAEVEAVYRCIKGWKMQIPNWDGQAPEERPPAYILIVADMEKGAPLPFDVGIAAQSITLAAAERNLACCMFFAFFKKQLAAALRLPIRYEPELLIAVGKAGEEVVLENMPANGSTSYWEDKNRVHHVPKLKLDDLLI